MTGIVETVDAGKGGGAAGAGASAGAGAAVGDATKTGSSPDAGAAAAAAAAAGLKTAEVKVEAKAGETQTPEQIAAAKTAADAEAARVAALTPEQKAAEEKAAKDKAAADDASPDYTGLKLADGWTLEQPMVAEALKLFGDNKLAPEAAQALIDFTATRDKALAVALNEHNAKQWETQAAGWKTATEKEFSAEQLGGAKEFAAKLFDKDALAYLEGLKLTNKPDFVRAMVKGASAIKDDTWVNGNAAGSGATKDARTHFPNSRHNP